MPLLTQRTATTPPAVRDRGRSSRRVTCDVWLLDLTDGRWDVPRAAALLSSAERARAERGTPAVRRRRVLVRAVLREVLGELLATAPGEVPLDRRDGRPVLAGAAAGSGLDVSCSTGDGLALVAVAHGTRVGVDVEPQREQDWRDAAAEGWLAPAEVAAVAALPPAERAGALTRRWTQKEAVLKAEGVGLRRDPATVPTPGGDAGRAGAWELVAVPVPDGHLASLATGRPVVPVIEERSPW
ncbi:4'-phosphopantetheinyl transferase family protein [Geodermatophilus telluris]|nr:4'-phosphopantetheinyl transferase superfamily protein [Geodermatophilus telluris]